MNCILLTKLKSTAVGPPLHLRPAVIRTVLLLFLVSWLLVASAYSGAVSPTSGIAGLDFAVFYHAAARLNAGQPLYQSHLPPGLQGGLYVYCPLLAFLLRPLALLPFHKALQVWFFVNAACLILAVLLYGASARLTWKTASLMAVLLLVSFRYWDTTMNFGLGQSNAIMLALIGGMLWADSRKRWMLMGMLIALAALFKVWLIGLLLYLVLRPPVAGSRRERRGIRRGDERPLCFRRLASASRLPALHDAGESAWGAVFHHELDPRLREPAPAPQPACFSDPGQPPVLFPLCRRLSCRGGLGICAAVAGSASSLAFGSSPGV